MDLITFAYGENVNLYRDVLRVSPEASDQEIQSAFVSRRYELFNELQNASISDAVEKPLVGPDGFPISMTVRHFTEKTMDALIASYRLLSDSEKRRQYNMSMSLAATKLKSGTRRVSISPQGVENLEDVPTASTRTVGEESSPMDESDDRSDVNSTDSRHMATPYNPNKGPTPTKDSGPRLNAKKRLFDSPNGSTSTEILERYGAESGTSEHTLTSRSDSFGTDTENSSTDNDSADDGTDEGEYEDEMDERERAFKKESSIKRKSSSPQTYHTPEHASSPPNRKVTWSESARSSATKQESRQKKNLLAPTKNRVSPHGFVQIILQVQQMLWKM